MKIEETKVDDTFIRSMEEYRQPDKSVGLIEACSKSVIVFAEHMLGIQLYSWQVKFLKDMQDVLEDKVPESEVLAITSRQIGKSLSVSVFALWAAVFNKKPGSVHNDTIICMVSRSDDQAKKLLKEVKKWYRFGDRFMRDKYRDEENKPIFGMYDSSGEYIGFFSALLSKSEPNNTTTISFEPYDPDVHGILLKGSKSGSSISCLPPTSKVLGFTFSIGIVDEAGHQSITDDFFKDDLYPTGDSTDAMWVYTSTPWAPCYDNKTEVLTRDGWKLFKDVDIDKDLFLTRDELDKASFKKATGKIDTEYYGDMYRFKTKTCDLLVTPNHSMVGKIQKSNKKIKITAEELYNKNTDFWISTNIDWDKKSSGVITIPETYLTKGKGKQLKKSFNLYSLKFIRFLGFWAADGHINHRNKEVCWTQNKGDIHDYYLNLTKELFGSLCKVQVKKHNTKASRVVLSNKQLYEYFKDIKNKGIDVFSYSKQEIVEFYKGLHDGDGHKILTWKNNLKKNIISCDDKYNKLNDSISLAQQIVLGGSVKVRNPTKNSNVTRVNGHVANRTKIKTYDSSQIWKEEYAGRVYCVTVPNGELFVRRNGKSCWSGNSGWWYELVDPDDKNDTEHIKKCMFSIEALKNEKSERAQKQYNSVQEKIKRLNKQGDTDSVQRSYYCRFVKGESSYFNPSNVFKIFVDYPMLTKYDKPCDMGVDFGGQVNSKTVITISELTEKGIIRRLYHQTYGVGEDNDLIMDMTNLMKLFNVQRVIVDDCPAGSSFIRIMEEEKGWDVHRMSFRADKVKKYGAFRVALRKERIQSYIDDELKTEMLALEHTPTSRQSNIEHAPGYSDDLIDSFLMSTYFFVEDEDSVTFFQY